jgi:hypothetical protein
MEIIENVFELNIDIINSEKYNYESNEVLKNVRFSLEGLNYSVEKDKTDLGKIKVPVLFGINGSLEKSFDADAYSEELKTVIEIEAGRGVTNYQFLKDLFQAFVMHDIDYLVIAVRNKYRTSKDFEVVKRFFDTLYSSERFKTPLKGILIVGY